MCKNEKKTRNETKIFNGQQAHEMNCVENIYKSGKMASNLASPSKKPERKENKKQQRTDWKLCVNRHNRTGIDGIFAFFTFLNTRNSKTTRSLQRMSRKCYTKYTLRHERGIYAITANPINDVVWVRRSRLLSMCALRFRRIACVASGRNHEHSHRETRRTHSHTQRTATIFCAMVFVCTFLFKPVNANMHTGKQQQWRRWRRQHINFNVLALR